MNECDCNLEQVARNFQFLEKIVRTGGLFIWGSAEKFFLFA